MKMKNSILKVKIVIEVQLVAIKIKLYKIHIFYSNKNFNNIITKKKILYQIIYTMNKINYFLINKFLKNKMRF